MKFINQNYTFITPATREYFVEQAKIIEIAARNCYKSEEKINEDSWKKILKSIIVNNHTAMLEFGHINIRLVTSRAVLAELTRHRIGISFAVESTRYCNYSKNKFGNKLTFIRPTTFFEWEHEAQKQFCNELKRIEETYFNLINNKCQPQQARDILPQALKTEIVTNINFRELLNIFNLRCSSKAHPDIDSLFSTIKGTIYSVFPELFGDDYEI